MAANPKDISADVVAVYNEHVQVISELKKAQWQNAYSIIALFGALIALREPIQKALPLDCALYAFAIIVPLALWCAGIWVIVAVHISLTERRRLIASSRPFLTQLAQSVYAAKRPEGWPPYSKDLHIPTLSILGTAAAAFVCGLLLWVRT